MNSIVKSHGYLSTIIRNKCPRCREGNLFLNKNPYKIHNFMKMNLNCTVCNQKTEIEEGFYYGTGYVSYALTIAFSIFTLIVWWLLIGFSWKDNRIFWWLGVNGVLVVLLQPWLMRLSRAIWLSIFVPFDSGRLNTKNKE